MARRFSAVSYGWERRCVGALWLVREMSRYEASWTDGGDLGEMRLRMGKANSGLAERKAMVSGAPEASPGGWNGSVCRCKSAWFTKGSHMEHA